MPNGAYNLLDYARQFDENGKEYQVVRILDKNSPIIRDAVTIESNSDSGHEYAVLNGLPTVAWRRAYEGVKPSKGSQTVVKETYGRMSCVSELDVAIAEKGGNVAAMRAANLENRLESMTQEAASKLIYGSRDKDEKAFIGFAARYNSLSGAKTSSQVVDFGAGNAESGNIFTSIYLIGWAKGKIFTFFPKGTKAGINTYDFSKNGPIDLKDANDGTYPGYKEQAEWLMGLAVQDWRYGARICNIPNPATLNENDKKALYEKFMYAVGQIHNLENCNLVAYCSRAVKDALRVGYMKSGGVTVYQVNNMTSSGNQGYANHDLVIDGIHIKAEDAIVHTEPWVVRPDSEPSI